MAGEIRLSGTGGGGPGGTTITKPVRKSRKLWSLQDRSVVSVHLLKANLAEDGCEEAQLDVAKKLLNGDSPHLDVPDTVQGDSARLAIYWFIKSSEQGNEEATTYLKECYESGKGINCQNVLDVKACINTPRNEKFTFRAARELYSKLCNGEEFITTTQLRARLEAKNYESRVTFCNKSWQDHDSKHNLDETFLMTSDEDDKDTSSSMSTTESEYLATGRDNEGVKLTVEDLLRVAAAFSNGDVPPISISSTSEVKASRQWNLASISTAFIFQFITIALGCKLIDKMLAVFLGLSFLSIWSSYNFILWRKRLKIFQDWSELFKSVLKEHSWNDKIPRSQFHKNYFRPYILTHIFCLAMFTTIDGHYLLKIIVGSIGIFSLLLGRICKPSRHWQLRVVYALQLISSFKIIENLEINNDWMPEWLDNIEKYVTFYLPSQHYFPTLSTWIHILQIILIVHFFIKRRSVYREILPEVLGIWWILKIIQWSLEHTTLEEYSILVGLSLLLFPLYITFESNMTIKKMFYGLGLTGLILVISFSGLAQLKISEINTPEVTPPIEWTEYELNCHRPAWKIQSVAETQIICQKYKGSRVKWSGKLSYVQIKDHEDTETMDIVFEVLMNIANKELLIHREESEWHWFDFIPNVLPKSQQDTHLALAPVTLHISTNQLNDPDRSNIIQHILNFRTGDAIEFIGTLIKNPGGFKPQIGQIETLYCISCAIANSETIHLQSDSSKSRNYMIDLKTFISNLIFPIGDTD